jgi:hypothetical protein
MMVSNHKLECKKNANMKTIIQLHVTTVVTAQHVANCSLCFAGLPTEARAELLLSHPYTILTSCICAMHSSQ